jgi:hypothetical protein
VSPPLEPAAPAADATVAETGPVVEWSVNPWRDHPARAVGAAVSAVGAMALASWTGLPPLTTLALAIAAALVLAPGYLSTRFRIDDLGIGRRIGPLGWETRGWARVRETRLGRSGLSIAGGPGGGALAALRAMHLPLPDADRHRLRDRIREALASHGH